LGLRPAPEFDVWLEKMGIFDGANRLADQRLKTPLLSRFSDLNELPA